MKNKNSSIKKNGKYVLGIECDGKLYHSSKSARERDYHRQKYLESKDKRFWRALISILPNGWVQKRTVTLNYQVLRAMYFARRHHKLQEWHDFCAWIESLPYAKELICYEK